MTDRWTDYWLDETFRGIRDHRTEDRAETKEEHTEIKRRVEAVSDQCHSDHKAVIARLDAQDSARDAARLETRKAILAFAGVLLTALIAAGVTLLAGGPPT